MFDAVGISQDLGVCCAKIVHRSVEIGEEVSTTVSDAPALRREAPHTARREGHMSLQDQNELVTAYHLARRAFCGSSLIVESESTIRSAAPGLLCATGVSLPLPKAPAPTPPTRQAP